MERQKYAGLAIFLTLGVVVLGFAMAPNRSLARGPANDSQDTTVSFARDVLPIFQKRCVECHGEVDENGEVFAEEELHLTSYEGVMAGSLSGSVVEPGDIEGSFMIEMIESGDMPAEGDLVPPEEIQIIRRWIAAGAPNN